MSPLRRCIPVLLLLAVLLFSAFAGCDSSEEPSKPIPTTISDLENALRDKPDVLSVRAVEDEGDDGYPGEVVPKQVLIMMKSDASARSISAVFRSLEEAVDRSEVSGIEVVLDGGKKATLATGAETHASAEMARDLVRAQQDDRIIEFRRKAYPTLPGVSITLKPGGFDQVVSVADRYVHDEKIDLVEVVSGDFTLIRDEVNEKVAFTDARQRFVVSLNRRYHLTGAIVTGRGPLTILVTPAQRAAVLDYVRNIAAPQNLGQIVVTAKS